jgi:spermidine synthase
VRDTDGGRVLDFDNGTVQSRMLADEPTRLVLEYTRLMMGFLLLHPAPARLAMIGLGGGSLAKYCRQRLPETDFTAVEISPAVIALRQRFALPPDGPRFRILCEDGAAFVRREGAPLDVLLVDGFDRGGQPAGLCSAAFYDACRERLDAGGVLVVNLHSDEPDCDACVARIGRAFAGRVVAVRADHSENVVVFAGAEAPFPPPFATIVERLRALEAEHPVDLGATARKILDSRAPRPVRWRRRRRGAG